MSDGSSPATRARHRRVGLTVMVVCAVVIALLHVRRSHRRGDHALSRAFLALGRMSAASATGDKARRADEREEACAAFRRAGTPWGLEPLVVLGVDLCERWPAALDDAAPPSPPANDTPDIEAVLRYARACLLVGRPADALPALTGTAARRDHALRVYRVFAERWVNAAAGRGDRAARL